MKINKLSVQHYKGIKQIEFCAHDDCNEVVGPNYSGKTSLLDSIVTAIMGPKAKDIVGYNPLRNGEQEGEVELDLGELIIKRKIFPKNIQRIKITATDGSKWNQTGLDAIFNKLCFDVTKFALAKPQEQADMIQAILPDDIRDLLGKFEKDIAKAKAERLELGRDLKKFGQLIKVDPAKPVDIEKINAELQSAMKYNEEQKDIEYKMIEQEKYINGIKDLIDYWTNELCAAQIHLENLNKELIEETGKYERLNKPSPRIQIEPLQRKLAEASRINQQALHYQDYQRRLKEQMEVAQKHEETEKWLTALREGKTKLIADAQLPVAGLEWDSTGVRVNGVPFEQNSDSEKMFISAMICMSFQVDLKILLLRNASLLDKKTFQRIAEACRERGFQPFFESVDQARTKEAIVISDGILSEENEFPW